MRATQPISAGFVHSVTTFRRTMVQAAELSWRLPLTIPKPTGLIPIFWAHSGDFFSLALRYFIHTS